MTGPFRNSRTATLFVVFFVHVVVQQIAGFPYEWPYLFSFGNPEEPVPRQTSFVDSGPATSVAKEYARESETSNESFRYGESWMPANFDNGNPPVNDKSQDKLTRDSDGEAHNENDRVGYAEDNGAEDENTNARTQDTEDVITQLINQALKDDVFLSPQKWAETLANDPFNLPDDESLSVKVQKTRSPANSPKKPTQTAHSSGNDRIIFPDNTPKQSLNPSTVSVPKCEGSTFCVDVPFYPSDSEIAEALKERYFEPISEPPSISERIGPMNEENGLCVSTEELVLPRSGMDDTNEWRIIYNNEQYVQSVKVEKCVSPDSACNVIDRMATGYKSSCKQKYIYRHLVGLGPNGTTTLPISMPSSCCCQLVLSSDPMVRLGITSDRRKRQSFYPD
ncbi:protein spaetzle-like [Venturia canescens]|uniref:protein spaetzle-like n=1 Tax=Venturia canescens TaxID=32260 RepID=UPI001C9D0756|nr:protein spaetzle-like [Venturia canescens]